MSLFRHLGAAFVLAAALLWWMLPGQDRASDVRPPSGSGEEALARFRSSDRLAPGASFAGRAAEASQPGLQGVLRQAPPPEAVRFDSFLDPDGVPGGQDVVVVEKSLGVALDPDQPRIGSITGRREIGMVLDPDGSSGLTGVAAGRRTQLGATLEVDAAALSAGVDTGTVGLGRFLPLDDR